MRFFTFHCSFASGPFLLRFKPVAKPFQVPFMEWEVNGTYKGVTTDLLGRKVGGSAEANLMIKPLTHGLIYVINREK